MNSQKNHLDFLKILRGSEPHRQNFFNPLTPMLAVTGSDQP